MSNKIISLNSQGYYDGDVNDFVKIHKPVAMVVNEHKRKDLRDLDVVDGYKLAAGYPATTSQRGVGVYVRNDVDFRRRRDLDSYARERTFETASVELPTKNVVVTGLYRSPKSSKKAFYDNLDDFAHKISGESHKKHVIAGDFNTNIRKNTRTKEVLKDHGLKYHLRSETHERGGCLDNFVTDFQPKKSRVMRANRDLISDHNPIEMKLPYYSKRSKR